MTESSEVKQILEEFNKDVKDFMDENSDKIACLIAYAVNYMFQPFLSSYQRYFNENVNLIYDSKTLYASHKDLPNFLCVYFVLLKDGKKADSESVHKDCKIYINNFAEFNSEILSGFSGFIYDIDNAKIIDELHQGDKETLKDMQFLKF